MNTTRINGKFASRLQKAEHEAKKWKQQAEVLISIMHGQHIRFRQMSEEINKLKHEITLQK
jgi:hypothetical protein